MRSSSTLIYKEFFGQDNPELPYELTLMILAHFPLNAVPTLALVNQAWKSSAHDDQLWRQRFNTHFGKQPKTSESPVDWSKTFKEAKKEKTATIVEEKLDEFANSKTPGSKEYLAANALRMVAFDHRPVSFLDAHSYQYQQEPLQSLYQQLKALDLIPAANLSTEDDPYGYGRPHFS